MALTALVFLFAFAIGLTLCVAVHPRYGLYTYMAAFYLHPPSRWWGEHIPDLRWSLLAAAVTMIAVLRQRQEGPGFLSDTFGKVLLVYAVWMAVQFPWVLNTPFHLEGTVLFGKYLLLFWLIFTLLRDERDISTFLLIHVAGCFYFGYLGWIAPPGGRLEGVGGPGLDASNPMAMHLATGAVCGGILLLSQRGWRWWFALAAMPFILVTIVQAASRGAFVALLAAGLFVLAMRPRVSQVRFFLFAFLGVVLFGYLAQETFWNRMSSVRTVLEDSSPDDMPDRSLDGRVALIGAEWNMALDHPFGAGHRGTMILSVDPAYLDPLFLSNLGTRASHNTFMAILVDQGFIGAGLFIILVFSICGRLRRLRSISKRTLDLDTSVLTTAIGGAIVVVLVAGLFTNYLKAEVFVWLLALLARLSVLATAKDRAQAAREMPAMTLSHTHATK